MAHRANFVVVFWALLRDTIYLIIFFELEIQFRLNFSPLFSLFFSEGRNSIGTVTPIKDATNQFVVSSDRFLYHLEWDGKGNNTGRLKELYKVEENKPDNQFNDGKFDVNGNLWIGNSCKNIHSNRWFIYVANNQILIPCLNNII